MQRCTHCNKYAVFAKYSAYFAYILQICSVCSICKICTLAYSAYFAYLLHIFYTNTRQTRRNLPGSRCIFSFFYIYIASMQFFQGRCIYMGGRCICAIFGIFSWNHGVGCLSAILMQIEEEQQRDLLFCLQLIQSSVSAKHSTVFQSKRDWCYAGRKQSKSQIVDYMLCKRSQQFAVSSHPLYSFSCSGFRICNFCSPANCILGT